MVVFFDWWGILIYDCILVAPANCTGGHAHRDMPCNVITKCLSEANHDVTARVNQ